MTRRLSLVAVLVLLAFPALAITYGQPDGNLHPEVGALVGHFTSGTFPYCSGTLIAPNVFLTAAHCNLGTSRVFVTFDSAFSSKSKLLSGTYYADPRYNQAQDDPHDIAVVVLDNAVKNVTPARLPAQARLTRSASARRSPPSATAGRNRSTSREARSSATSTRANMSLEA